MDNAILQMLNEYKCESTQHYENALKEIMQEIALLGLWRGKFFEHALFYGGSALRILYGLPRFSEDLDFSLLIPNQNFDFKKYQNGIQTELESFGFLVEVESKIKNFETEIDSAFIKAGTRINFLKIGVPSEISQKIQGNQVLKIKVDLDTNPPDNFKVEVRDLFRPIPFQVKTMTLPDLFAGKMHAILARNWNLRVKGRDFFDYLWYLGKNSPLNLRHLESRLLQSGNLKGRLSLDKFQEMLKNRFDLLDIDSAIRDVSPFLNQREKASLDLWTKDYFLNTVDRIIIQKD